MNKKLKVVVVGTGNVAAIAIRALKGREDMELVGVWGRRESLVGTDSGLLDLDEPNGVLITNSKEELFALKPDCAVMAINVRDPMQAAGINGEWYKDFLTRGINVVLNKNRIYIDLHVIVAYGVSIIAVADNLMNNVKYKVEEYTGLQVEKINIFVEGVRVID